MSSVRPGASAATSVPRQNSVIAAMKIVRVWNRWSRNPVIGMTTAIVSRNAVVSHCAALASTPRLTINGGIATPMIVSFRITTNADTKSSRITAAWWGAIWLESDMGAAAAMSAEWVVMMECSRGFGRAHRPWPGRREERAF